MNNRSWGTPKDWEVWARLLVAADDGLAHRLWCAVIREVAAAASAQTSLSEADESEADNLVNEWQNESLPAGSDIAWVLGELDYFRDIDLSWDEKISLAGEACSYASDVVWDLTGRLAEYPDARDAITEGLVEDFFSEWRTRFLLRVLRAAEALKAEKK
jgi:hypothetical protein